jgi:hypothetical protein
MVHSFYPESYPVGTVYKQGRGTSIVEVGRFEISNFRMNNQELATFFGIELAKMVVDECLTGQSQQEETS